MLRLRLASFVPAFAAFLGLALLAAAPVGAEDNDCHRVGLEVTCTVQPGKVILVGDAFEVTATVRNTGDVPIANVTFAMLGGDEVQQVGDAELRVVVEKLEPGQTRELRSRFTSSSVGLRRVNASARDGVCWAAAGCVCNITVQGLPALQTEMIDTDMNRSSSAGVFAVGEEFLYTLTVENDGGTANTPELKVLWELPPELELVSGTGDQGAIVTGSGRAAESSTFSLRPNQVYRFELVVRVKTTSPTNLVQTRATVVTATGGQELANESESTTIRGAGD